MQINRTRENPIPRIGLYLYRKKYEELSKEEGIDEIITIET